MTTTAFHLLLATGKGLPASDDNFHKIYEDYSKLFEQHVAVSLYYDESLIEIALDKDEISVNLDMENIKDVFLDVIANLGVFSRFAGTNYQEIFKALKLCFMSAYESIFNEKPIGTESTAAIHQYLAASLRDLDTNGILSYAKTNIFELIRRFAKSFEFTGFEVIYIHKTQL